jgi:ribonuclease HI
MRSLFSQSQTPTAPRRAVGFFRSGCLAGCPARLITQSTSGQQGLFRCPFQPSTEATLTERSQKSTQTIGATHQLDPVNNELCNLLQHGSLLRCVLNWGWFYTENYTTPATWKNSQCDPIIHLDAETISAHLANSTKELLMSELVAYVDGGSLGNPGPSGIGVVIDGCASGPIRISRWIGHQDNNVAEYVALLEALQCALSLKAKALHVYSDSQVVVRQMRGEYICRSSRLYSLHWTCRKLARALSFSISHVPREDNAEANQLANTAVREREAGLRH